MASNHIVWGIDIGNTSLKALRCTAGSEPGTMQVLGFDYIEHSKVLSQPGADAAQIMAETIAQFLSRNDIAGEKVAISVSGQNALWRFQPLPPVDPRKLKDLVKYEVRQWLPFDLDEVIWNYRQVGGFQEGNILIDANIFMYAMKKELTNKTLNQYESNGLSVDSIQGVPIALYNCYVNERYEPGELDGADLSSLNDYDVLINVGTDSTEVVITNGVSVWLRNIVLGGNAFTKALTKSLKLTFSNAEHIKRNAATSQDPKAVILAMRSVFNELYAEIDRSIKYYCSLNKRANIRKIYAFGNAMKLPGLRQFLAKSSGYEVEIPSRFKRLEGQEVLANPQFTGNLSSFSIAYGLALEQLHQATLSVNLMPKEVLRERYINSKKPWALAAAAILILAMAIQYIAATMAFSKVDTPEYDRAYSAAKDATSLSQKIKKDVSSQVSDFKTIDEVGKTLTSNVEGRLTWLEFLTVLNTIFPADSLPPDVFSNDTPTRKKAAEITAQNRVYIDNIEVLACEELSTWFEGVRQWYSIDDIEAKWFEEDSPVTLEDGFNFTPTAEELIPVSTKAGAKGKNAKGKGKLGKTTAGKTTAKPAAGKTTAKSAAKGKTGAKGGKPGAGGKGGADTSIAEYTETSDARLALIPAPTGPGRIVQLHCYHYHNPESLDDPNRGPEYVRRVFLPRIKHGSIELPVSLEKQRIEGKGLTETWTYKEFGLNYPVMLDPGPIDNNYRVLDPEAAVEQLRKIQETRINGTSGTSSRRGMSMGGPSGPGPVDPDTVSMGPGGMMSSGMGPSGPTGPTGPGGPSGPGPSGPGPSGMGGGISSSALGNIANQMSDEKILKLRRFDFDVQMVWVETPPTLREKQRAEREAKRQADEKSGAKNGAKGGKPGAGANSDNAAQTEGGEGADESASAGTAPAAENAEPSAEAEEQAAPQPEETPAEGGGDAAEQAADDEN
ncbi:MAG: pilus assembly protein PilM [Thermoguttaceae bacterium]|nr:pilus assembly protein PilM [Thermoguttaceae bacterium]MBR3219374.1 pilus assembly protein PilM [Thermoguttaceae bacterium]